MVGNRTDDHRACADLDVIADRDVSKYLRAGADDHVIAQRRVALTFLFSRAAERHALVDEYVVADLGGLADHHSRSVIDEEAAADGGAGVDFDLRQEPAHLADESRQDRAAHPVQPVRDPVKQDGVEAGVTENDLEPAARRRIAVPDRM